MRVLFNQLFQSESWKLYRNLGVFSFTFTPVHHSLAIFRVFHALAGSKRATARRLLYRNLRPVELLAPRSKKVRNVVNGIVLGTSISAVRPRPAQRRRGPGAPGFGSVRGRALVFIFIAEMALAVVGALIRSGLSRPRRRTQLFQKLRRHFLQKS